MSKTKYMDISYYERIPLIHMDGQILENYFPTPEENDRDDITVEYKYTPIYRFDPNTISNDEIIAKRLCSHTVIEGKEYELLSTEVAYDEKTGEFSAEFIVEKPKAAKKFFDEVSFSGDFINVEFREFHRLQGVLQDCPLRKTLEVNSHFDVIDDFLSNDVVYIPGLGHKQIDSREIDHDRNCYVIYFYEKTM